ncbi:MAG: DoxX family protein [Synechococcales bacterium]|nr:DoxX family protein [Synechococcales bacterium]
MNITSRLFRVSLATLRSNLSANYWSQAAWTVLRVVAGTVMIHNGLDKLANIESFAEAYVSVIGLPFPIFFSYVAAFSELIGAPLLILGLFTRPAALALCSTMLVAMYHHIKVAGLSIPYLELSTLYAATFLFFLVNGGGLFAADTWIASWLGAIAPREQLETSKVTADAAKAEAITSQR